MMTPPADGSLMRPLDLIPPPNPFAKNGSLSATSHRPIERSPLRNVFTTSSNSLVGSPSQPFLDCGSRADGSPIIPSTPTSENTQLATPPSSPKSVEEIWDEGEQRARKRERGFVPSPLDLTLPIRPPCPRPGSSGTLMNLYSSYSRDSHNIPAGPLPSPLSDTSFDQTQALLQPLSRTSTEESIITIAKPQSCRRKPVMASTSNTRKAVSGEQQQRHQHHQDKNKDRSSNDAERPPQPPPHFHKPTGKRQPAKPPHHHPSSPPFFGLSIDSPSSSPSPAPRYPSSASAQSQSQSQTQTAATAGPTGYRTRPSTRARKPTFPPPSAQPMQLTLFPPSPPSSTRSASSAMSATTTTLIGDTSACYSLYSAGGRGGGVEKASRRLQEIGMSVHRSDGGGGLGETEPKSCFEWDRGEDEEEEGVLRNVFSRRSRESSRDERRGWGVVLRGPFGCGCAGRRK
ncbi:hypothetical protein K402DRAFT_158285 [Aulographum hederae CBS 113979]|uniref:Uncharacterized protein n=1 Tax=Aulographum hederae CBS 113979 TaxID=1176131 RepID=A0A6G1GSC6_9PEZI|nr:hypothetical protein K402DRAFT_158285 [Aulographum hederae CBS 113979]